MWVLAGLAWAFTLAALVGLGVLSVGGAFSAPFTASPVEPFSLGIGGFILTLAFLLYRWGAGRFLGR